MKAARRRWLSAAATPGRSAGLSAGLSLSLALGLMAAMPRPALAGTVDVPVQAGGPFSVSVKSLKERRFAATIHQQYDFSCGSAALSTLLTHQYTHAVDEQAVFSEMLALGDVEKIRHDGFSMLDMKRYLAAHGFEADGFEASLADLASAGPGGTGLPAIALINERGYNHFVVVKGLRNGRVLIGDPAGGTRAMPAERFERLRVNTILFVIGNRQQLAQFNREQDWSTVPNAPLAGRNDSAGTFAATLPKLGPADF